MTRISRGAAAFTRNADGGVAITAAIVAVPILVGLAGMASYANAIAVKQQAQAATDAAALATMNALLANNIATDNVDGVAKKYFTMNGPASATSTQTSFSASAKVNEDGTVVSATVNYCGAQPSLFSSLMGSTDICASATTKAPVSANKVTRGSMYGNSEAWGDPHLIGAKGQYGQLSCTDGKWTSIFGDYQIQVNSQCRKWGSGENLAENIFADVTITAGSHSIYIQSGYNPGVSNVASFKGVVTVDGNTVTPSAAGSYPLLSDSSQNLTATLEYWYPNSPALTYAGQRGWNYVEVKTADYDIIVSYYNYGIIEVSASHAGACGTPAGALGQSYNQGQALDLNGAHFETVGNDPWQLNPNFSNNCLNGYAILKQGRPVISQ